MVPFDVVSAVEEDRFAHCQSLVCCNDLKGERYVRLEGAEYETLRSNARRHERKATWAGRHTYLCHAPPTELTSETAATVHDQSIRALHMDLTSCKNTQSTGEIARSDG